MNIFYFKSLSNASEWVTLGDRCNAFFFKKSSPSLPCAKMKQLYKPDGNVTNDDVQMQPIAIDYFQTLLIAANVFEVTLNVRTLVWNAMHPKVSSVMNDHLMQPILEAEIWDALKTFQLMYV